MERWRSAPKFKCLTLVPGVDLSLDAHSVQDFFGFGYVVDPKTIYQGISKLPAATTMLIKQGGVPKFRRYWDVRDEAEKWSDAPIGEDELRAKLGAAVKSRLVVRCRDWRVSFGRGRFKRRSCPDGAGNRGQREHVLDQLCRTQI